MLLSTSKRLRWLGLGAILLAGVGFGIGAVDDIPVEQLIQRYSYSDSRFVTIDGLSVHYRERTLRGQKQCCCCMARERPCTPGRSGSGSWQCTIV